jgi:hypothetical protein
MTAPPRFARWAWDEADERMKPRLRPARHPLPAPWRHLPLACPSDP